MLDEFSLIRAYFGCVFGAILALMNTISIGWRLRKIKAMLHLIVMCHWLGNEREIEDHGLDLEHDGTWLSYTYVDFQISQIS